MPRSRRVSPRCRTSPASPPPESRSSTVGGAEAPTTTSYTYDANDRLLTETTAGTVTTYTYDANGNTKTKQSPGTLIEYAYDDANRLVELRQAGTRITYAYDADGLRIAQTDHTSATPVTTHYVQDGSHAYSQVIEAHVEQGERAELSAIYNFADGLLSQTRYVAGIPTTRYVHQDGFGSTRFLTDQAAVVSDRWSYDAFGEEVERSGNTPTEHLYRGEQFDQGLGLYYLRARYYNAGVGRFSTADEFSGLQSAPMSLNKFGYGNADPTNDADPSGYFAGAFGEFLIATAGVATLTAVAVAAVGAGALALGPAPYFDERLQPSYSNAIEANKAEQCARQHKGPDECDSRMPVIFLGHDVKMHTFHVATAIDNFVASPLINYRTEENGRGWLRRAAECKNATGKPLGLDCDEYPYNIAVQGDRENYASGRVHIRPVLSEDNQRAGSLLFHRLLSPCRLQRNPATTSSPLFDGVSLFAVVPTPHRSKTAGRCSNGKMF